MNTVRKINSLVGNMDLYLLDHLLKGKLEGRKNILDAGCGEGRNLTYFAGEGLNIHGIDKEPLAVKMCRMRYSNSLPENFICGELSRIPWDDEFFDLVISSAVLHFAQSHTHFMEMWRELTRVTAMGGLLFLRMASLWGISDSREFPYYLTDSVLDEMLDAGWVKAEPVKSVLVEKDRSMAVLLLERGKKL